MSETFEIRRCGSDWTLMGGTSETNLLDPDRGLLEDAIARWRRSGEKPMRITTPQAYAEAAARIQTLSDAPEGGEQAVELAELVAAVRHWEARKSSLGVGDASAPGNTHTAQRAGQPGAEDEHRAGPNPRSPNPTGPHPPFEESDTEGLAAEKHTAAPTETSQDALPADRPSGTIRLVRGD